MAAVFSSLRDGRRAAAPISVSHCSSLVAETSIWQAALSVTCSSSKRIESIPHARKAAAVASRNSRRSFACAWRCGVANFWRIAIGDDCGGSEKYFRFAQSLDKGAH